MNFYAKLLNKILTKNEEHINIITQQLSSRSISNDSVIIQYKKMYQLVTRAFHQVKLINITAFTRAAAAMPERDLTQATYLSHDCRRRMGIDHIDLVASLIGFSQQAVRRELRFYFFRRYRVYDLIHNGIIFSEKAIQTMSVTPSA